MTAIQSLITTSSMGGGAPPPPPPPDVIDALYYSDNDAWYCLGTTLGNGTQSGLSATTYAYSNGSTGKVLNFTGGGEYFISPNLSIGNATWQSNAITIDIWFYPTANGVQLMSELGAADINSGYHYSMFEIATDGYFWAHFYNGTPIVSSNTVTLNAWNHIWITEDTQGGHNFELNGVGTGIQNPVYTRSKPSNEAFVIGSLDITNMGKSASAFQGKISDINIHDYVAASTFNNTKAKYVSLPTVFQSGVPGATDGTWGLATINGTYGTWPPGTPAPGTGVILASGSYVSVPAILNLTSWSVEVIAELNPTGYWATVWGNDSWNAGQGYLAYLGNSSDFEVGTAGGGTSGTSLPGINISDKAHWTFVNDGSAIHVYRNGAALTTGTGFVAPSAVPANDIFIGARHGNGGTGATDFCPGTYYYFNIRNTALDSTGVTSAFESIRGTYGL